MHAFYNDATGADETIILDDNRIGYHRFQDTAYPDTAAQMHMRPDLSQVSTIVPAPTLAPILT